MAKYRVIYSDGLTERVVARTDTLAEADRRLDVAWRRLVRPAEFGSVKVVGPTGDLLLYADIVCHPEARGRASE